MTKRKSTKRALLLSALSLLVCVSMLVGSTFAWFTDSVTSSGNKIQAGTLKVDLELLEDGKWNSIKESKKAIFNYDKWEPGYTDVKVLKIVNEGSLALKWVAKFVSTNDLSKLAEVIDVYVCPSETELAMPGRDLTGYTKVGTVAEFVNTISETTNGTLTAEAPTNVAYLGIALKMQEGAGNEYQGLDLGGAFDIQILATQYTCESDSFDNQYDADAKFDRDIWDGKTVTAPTPDADGVYHITNAAELVGMMDVTGNSIYSKKTIVLENNIDLAGRTVKGIGSDGTNFAGIFDGQGYTISNFKIDATNRKYYAGLFNQVSHGGTVKNLTVKNATIQGTGMVGAIASSVDSNAVIDNCKAIDCTLIGVKKVGAVVGYSLGSTVTNNYAENCIVMYSEADGGEILGYQNTGSTVANNTAKNVTVTQGALVSSTDALIDAIKNAPVGATSHIILADGTYAGDIAITVAALGKSGGDVIIEAAKGAKPVITGTVTLGYRNQGTGATMYNANVTFKGITFDAAEAEKHSIDVQDVKSFNLIDCTIIGDGEYGITSARGNGTGTSKIEKCTFENAAMQLLGNYATGLVIDGCTFNNSRINVQAGNSVTVQNCEFNNTLTAANVGDSFYAIRSNSTPITVKDCKINIDSELTEVAPTQAKWYLLANRGTTNWTVENVAVTLTDAALMQTELDITACTSSGKINATNLTVNGVQQ